ncbi:TetR family transcriptional regulator [Cellulomonas sp. NPDC089187]|uniref:TetR/AcrR family transcriptional regulator n=1 Tax=Cellulomonas sp. NPDC089187 TaxID=3154970 RepID=UPI00342F8066
MSDAPAPTHPRPRRHDPGRRDRIVDVCIEVIAAHGVEGVSLRRVAEAADVPLGSMTYHFSGRDELLRVAFTRFAESVSDRWTSRIAALPTDDREAAIQAVVDLITQDVFPDTDELVLTHELYTLAARDPRYRELTNAWMRRSRQALERSFDPATARILDALIEGLSIHRALDTEPPVDADVELAVRRVTRAD